MIIVPSCLGGVLKSPPAMETLVGQPGMFLNSSVDRLMVDDLSQ